VLTHFSVFLIIEVIASAVVLPMENYLFPPELIPPVNSLPEGYTLRPLMGRDYERGVLDVLSVLTTVGDISKEQFAGNSPLNPLTIERFEELCQRNKSQLTIVIENPERRIVGVGSLLVDAKLYLAFDDTDPVSTTVDQQAESKILRSPNPSRERS
jgi:hypothetical protein